MICSEKRMKRMTVYAGGKSQGENLLFRVFGVCSMGTYPARGIGMLAVAQKALYGPT